MTHWIDQWGARDTKFFQGRLKPGAEQNAEVLVSGLGATWQMIEGALTSWTVDDLRRTLRHDYQGKTYAITRQWILWRVMAHDLHHGGELAFALGIQGVSLPELGDQGGHLTEVSLAE